MPSSDTPLTFNKAKDSYRAMLDALPAMVYYLDKSQQYSYVNLKYAEWLGSDDSLIGKGFETNLEEETYSKLKKYTDQALSGETVHFEADVRLSKNLNTLSIDATLIPDRDNQDHIIGYLALIQDVTDKKQVHKKLENRAKELQDYVDHAPIGLHWVDGNGVILWANKAELDMLGYEAEEYIGHHIAEFHIEQKKIDLILFRLGNNETLNQYESELRCKNGLTRAVQINSNVLWEEGKFVHTRCFTIDVTEQQKLFEALRNSEQKYRDLAASLENMVEERTKDIERKNEELRKNEERYQRMIGEVEDYAILLIDLNGIVQNWNKGAEKIKGYTEKEILGKSFKLFYLPEDQASGLPEKLIGEATIKGKALQEGWRRRKDGTAFWGSVLITALHNDKGQIVGFTKVTRDLTERKLAEEKFKRYAQELEFQNKELEQFAYAASHDMKEPLRKIIFYNTFINEGAGYQLPEKEKTFLSRSINAASRLQRLIDDLLDYSKTTLRIEDFESIDLNIILEEVISSNKETLEEKQVILQSDKLPVVKAINFQMRQLFDNLLTNAIKYYHPQRDPLIQVSYEIVPGTDLISNKANPAGNYHKISIVDNGIGFDPEQSDKIFDLFQRLREKTDASGTGIGLAICRKILQNHRGFIEAVGKINEGALFFVFLPVDNG